MCRHATQLPPSSEPRFFFPPEIALLTFADAASCSSPSLLQIAMRTIKRQKRASTRWDSSASRCIFPPILAAPYYPPKPALSEEVIPSFCSRHCRIWIVSQRSERREFQSAYTRLSSHADAVLPNDSLCPAQFYERPEVHGRQCWQQYRLPIHSNHK